MTHWLKGRGGLDAGCRVSSKHGPEPACLGPTPALPLTSCVSRSELLSLSASVSLPVKWG